jgi:hypothetical protein
MSKNTITRAQAIENSIRACQSMNEGAEFRTYWDDTIDVLVKMHEQLVKPRKAVVSKARVLNESLAVKIAKKLPAEGLTSKGIVGLGVPEVTTTQKAVAVMRVAEEIGLVERVKDKKTITFKPIADATPETFFPMGEPMGE